MGKAKPTKKKYGKQQSVGRWYSPDPIHKANIERDKRNRKRAAQNPARTPSAACPPVPPLPPPQPSFPSPTKCAVNEKHQRTKQYRKIGWGRQGQEAAPKAVLVKPTWKTRTNWSTSTIMKEAVESYLRDQGNGVALTAAAHAVK